jgi:transcriptional regulator NrdR family protein
MLCPICDGQTKVYDSRPEVDCVTRRRKCLECGHCFKTVEVDADYIRKDDKTNECN